MFAFSYIGENLKKKVYLPVTILITLIVVIALVFVARYVSENVTLPPCLTYQLFGINCPGCGMTRSVTALVHGDILLSLRQNALVIIGIIIALIIYVRILVKYFIKPIKVFNLKNRTIYIMLILVGVYSVLRNIIPILTPI